MLGAIAGDVIGSVFEHHPIKSISFPLFSRLSRFTDDTVFWNYILVNFFFWMIDRLNCGDDTWHAFA